MESRESTRVGDVSTVAAEIAYRYTVGGREYTGDRISFGSFYSSSRSGRAVEYFERYPPGSQAEVHYHRSHPEMAVLEPGLLAGNHGLLGIGVSLVFLGFALPAAQRRAGPRVDRAR